MLSSEEWRFAIEDARARHEAIIALVYVGDQKALSLLSLYVTLGLAAASGFVAGTQLTTPLKNVLMLSSLGAALTFTLGAFFCLRALAPATINLPGRSADFWLWAAHPNVKSEEAYEEYLKTLKKKHPLNNALTDRTACALSIARRLGIAAPVVAIVIAMATEVLSPI